MIDSCGRNIDYLRLSVTDLCNYRCRYCMPEEGVCKRTHSEILSLEELEAIARAAVALGITKIRLTGGEPLVRRGIVELCRRLRRIPELQELCLTTNGSLLPDLAAPLREAGVDRLNISLDTLRPERFTQMTCRGELGQVLEGLAAAEEAGFTNLKLNTVLIGGFNDDEVSDFVRLTQVHPWEVRFIELMPMAPVPSGIAAASCRTPPSSGTVRNCGRFLPGVLPDGIVSQAPEERLVSSPRSATSSAPTAAAFA